MYFSYIHFLLQVLENHEHYKYFCLLMHSDKQVQRCEGDKNKQYTGVVMACRY